MAPPSEYHWTVHGRRRCGLLWNYFDHLLLMLLLLLLLLYYDHYQCHVEMTALFMCDLLHFAWVVDDAKCISVTRFCVSVPRRIPTLLHGPGFNLVGWLEFNVPSWHKHGYIRDEDVTWGNGRGCSPSCALLGGFAIGARVSLLWQDSANAKCQRVLVLALCLVFWLSQWRHGVSVMRWIRREFERSPRRSQRRPRRWSQRLFTA